MQETYTISRETLHDLLNFGSQRFNWTLYIEADDTFPNQVTEGPIVDAFRFFMKAPMTLSFFLTDDDEISKEAAIARMVKGIRGVEDIPDFNENRARLYRLTDNSDGTFDIRYAIVDHDILW